MLAPLTDTTRKEFNVPAGAKGVLIVDVDDLSEAAQKRLVPGDLIIEINQQDVSSPKDVEDIFKKAEKAKRGSVLL